MRRRGRWRSKPFRISRLRTRFSVRSFPRAWAEAMTLEMPRDFTLERILGGLGGGQDGARLKKIEHAEAVHRRAHHDLGPVKLELRLDYRALHDLESSEHRLEAAGRARRMRAWAAGHVDGDEQVGAADQVVERQRIDRAAVDQDALAVPNRPDEARNRHRAGDGRQKRSFM